MNENQDISLPVALLLALGVFTLFFGLQYKNDLLLASEWILLVYEQFSFYLHTFLIFLLLNIVILSLYFKRFLKLSKQGARLRNIKDDKEQRKKYIYSILFLGVISTISVKTLLNLYGTDIPVILKQHDIFKIIELVYLVNASLLLTLLTYRAADFFSLFNFSKKAKKKIKSMPSEKEQLVLGTTKSEEGNEEWLSIPKKALNGSILITGSIGSGKTAGAILPYFKQSLSNFEKLSILALDPKRTFVPKAVELIKEHKRDAVVRRIRLDGDESFNPVYLENALQSSRFVKIAEMIRASAINFSGGSSDSPFWEISSFNLIKNCVIYCAAMKDYFTLKDIYQSMINATNVNLGSDLSKLVELKMKRQQIIMMPQMRVA